VHAGDPDFAVTSRNRAAEVRKHFGQRAAPAAPARAGNDAVAALLLAAGLDTERERRATRDTRRQRCSARAFSTARVPLRRRESGIDINLIREPLLGWVRDDAHHVRQRAYLVWPAGRVTSGDDDARVGIVARYAADRLPRALIG